MLSVKQELLAALSAGLEHIAPGSGDKAAFESPKVAAHGDLATTVAMQLAKPLKQNPRQLAENLRDTLLKTEQFQRWVTAVEIVAVEETVLTVRGLDAINGTPVLDIKPYFPAFDRRDATVPAWVQVLMDPYF